MDLSKHCLSLASLTIWLFLSLFSTTSIAAEQMISEPAAAEREAEPSQSAEEPDFNIALQPWAGDYQGMVQRKMIRILVPYSRTHYFLDGAAERGIIATAGREFEREVNRREGLRTRLVRVVFIPVKRSQLLPWLTMGLGDIAAGDITAAAARQMGADSSEPLLRNSEEILVSSPNAPAVSTIEDLAGKEIYVQASSSHHQSLDELNQSFRDKGLAPIKIELLDEVLEVDEILEMVHAGLIPMTVSHRHLVQFWSQVFTGLNVHEDIVIADHHDIVWAFREQSPQLQEVLNEFLLPRRHRTTFGNILMQRYLQNVDWVKDINASRDRARFDESVPFFRTYGRQYQLDPLLLAALAYQESRIDQSVRSPAGALGVMQILPVTGSFLNAGDITQLEPNILAGTRYLRYLINRLSGNTEIDQTNQVLFGLAAYNGGQTRIRRLRREAAETGLNPDEWFHNVELVAARVIGRETVQYVRNVYMYYLTYQRIEAKRAQRAGRALQRQQ